MKTILFIGGGRETVYAVKQAQGMGLKAMVADENPACACSEIADEFMHAFIDDAMRTAHVAGGRDIDGVICAASDFPATTAHVAEALCLNGITPLTGWTSSSKLEMKRAFLEAGLPIPKFNIIRSGEHLKALVKERNYKLVIKPDDSRGARGVLSIDGRDVVNRYEESKQHSSIGRVIAEEWIDGRQVSTEGLVINGACHTVAISDRNYSRLDEFSPYVIEDGGSIPTELSPYVCQKIEAVMQRAADVLGIKSGPIKGDLVVCGSKPYIIEIAPRLSGGYLSTHQIPFVYGVDLIGCAIRQAIGERVFPEELTPNTSKHMAIRFMFPPEGILEAVSPTEPLEGFSGVELCEVFVKPGDKVGPYRCHPDRAGVLITSGIDRRAAIRTNERFMKCVSFSMEEKDEQKGMGEKSSGITTSTIRNISSVSTTTEGTDICSIEESWGQFDW